MLQEWLGADQTIDLKQWAMCLGLRRAYLDTLPNRRWAGHLIVLDEQRVPEELLRFTLDHGQVRLRFLPPDALKISGTLADDLISLATRVAAASPPDPPPLFTALMTRRAVSDMLLAVVSGPQRAELFRARLAAGYGTQWAVHALTSIGHDLIQSILKNDLWSQLLGWTGDIQSRIIVFHRDGIPTTRGGVRITNGRTEMLSSEELISVPGATWVDERFIGESVDLFDRLLKQPPKNPLAAYAELNNLFKRDYLRLPGKSVSALRLSFNLFKAGQRHLASFKPKPSVEPAATPVAPPARLTLALYFQINGTDDSDEAQARLEQRCQTLFDTLALYPQVKATIGWAETALNNLASTAPDILDLYRAGVNNGRFETVCVLDTLPFSMLPTRDLIRAQAANWEISAAQKAQLWARGLVPMSQKLGPGWGEALRGHDYQYVAFDESVIHRAYAEFDPTRPISIEGWQTVGFHHELSRALRLNLDKAVLKEYLHILAADYTERTLAVAVDTEAMHDMSWLDVLFQYVEEQKHDLIFLSELASAHAQGTTSVLPDFSNLEAWTSNECSRKQNAAFTHAWGMWQDVNALGDHIQVDDQERLFSENLERIVSSVQHGQQYDTCPAAADSTAAVEPIAAMDSIAAMNSIAIALEHGHALAYRWMLQLISPLTLPERALGALRVFEPLDLGRQGDLLTVHLPLPDGVPPNDVAFFDRGLAVPAQWLSTEDGQASFLLAVDIEAGGAKDLLVLSDAISPTPEGLDVTVNRLCNPSLAVLLDAKGQVTSIRFQGQERVCGPGNRVHGYALGINEWLNADLAEADICVTSTGPVRGAVTVHQVFAGGIELTRHLHLGLFNPLLDCVTEIYFPQPTTLAGSLVVGKFDISGEQTLWSLPLQAGTVSCSVAEVPPVIFAAQDTIDIRKDWQGLRYMAHQVTTRTFQYAARPINGGLRLGLIASMPAGQADLKRLGTRSGLGFPGHTYEGRYTYRYALQPLSPEFETHAAIYNRPLLWTFYPKHG